MTYTSLSMRVRFRLKEYVKAISKKKARRPERTYATLLRNNAMEGLLTFCLAENEVCKNRWCES